MSIDKFGNDSVKLSKKQGVNPADAKSAQDIREKKKAQEIDAQLQKGLSGTGFEDDFGYGDNVVFTSQGAVSVNPEDRPIQPIDTKINSPEKPTTVADERVVERNKNSLTGNVGVIIFNPNRFVDAKNTPEQISAISDLLEQVDVPQQLKKALIEALEKGKVAFAHNEIGEDGRLQNPEEILTLTEGDIELILDYAEKCTFRARTPF